MTSSLKAAPIPYKNVVSKKYNAHFLKFLKSEELEKFKTAFYIDSVDRTGEWSNSKKERLVTLYTKPKLLSPNICFIKRYLYKHQNESYWKELENTSATYISKSTKKSCPKLTTSIRGYGGHTSPEHYIPAPINIEPTILVKLMNSKNVIQKQARWPEKHLKWGDRGHKNMKPPLNKLKSISQPNLSKNEYFLTYSCINGCSCLGNLVFKVENKNNKFYRVIEVDDEYGACI
jgi:hypothetical protein